MWGINLRYHHADSWNLACKKMYIVPVSRSENLERNPMRCAIDVLPINSWTHETMGPVCFLMENEIVVQMDNQTRCFGDCFQQRPDLSQPIDDWGMKSGSFHTPKVTLYEPNVHQCDETTPSNRLASSLPHPPSGLKTKFCRGGSFGRFYDFLASHSSEPMGPQHSGLVHWQWHTMKIPEVWGRENKTEKQI